MTIQLSEHFTYRKLLRYTFPSIVMMIFMSIYTIVDGIFVSNFAGKTAFAAVNLIAPFLLITSTVGFMFGTGGTAIVTKAYGEGDRARANRYFSLFVAVAFFIGLIIAVVSFLFIRPIARLLGADGELLTHCVRYARIVLLALPFCILQYLFQSFFSAAEKPRLGLFITAGAGIVHVALDALLILLLPEEQKLIGVAVASAASQILGGGLSVLYFLLPNTSLFRLAKPTFDGRAILNAAVNGSSEFVSTISASVIGILFNYQLLAYAGEDGVSAYGVMMYVSMIFSAVFVGLSVGSAPIVGYHYGAKNGAEIHNLLRKLLVIIGISGASMALISFGLSAPLSRIFVSYDPALLALTVRGMRIFSFCFAFMGFAYILSGFFTALSDGLTSALISFLRTWICQVGAVLLFPLLFGIDGIWYSVIAAEVLAVGIEFTFLRFKRKRFAFPEQLQKEPPAAP